jgi:hypothetical protein
MLGHLVSNLPAGARPVWLPAWARQLLARLLAR